MHLEASTKRPRGKVFAKEPTDASYSLFANAHDAATQDTAWLAVYPPMFILMGFLWPTLATFTIGFGSSNMIRS